MSADSAKLDVTFTGTIGVEVKGMTWSGVLIPGSAEMFGTTSPVRVDLTVDGESMRSVELLSVGGGEHMLLLDPRFRSRIHKELGDEVHVHLTRRHA